MTITVDDVKITVDICDEHAETATLKSVKEAYATKKTKIDELMAQAKALGLTFTSMQQQGSLIVPVSAPAPETKQTVQPNIQRVAQPTPVAQPALTVDNLDSDEFISASIVDSRQGMVSVGGETKYGHIPGHSSINAQTLSEDTAKISQKTINGKVKMALFQGRNGSPLALPETRVDGLGTTRLKVANVDTDSKLQSRFKRMVQDSAMDRAPDFTYRGYEDAQVTCTLCRGTQTIKTSSGGRVSHVMCPKCNGAGTISKY